MEFSTNTFAGSGGGGGSYLAASALNGVMSVSNTGNGLVTISQIISDLLVGDNTSSQSIGFTGGTNDYYNITVGISAGDTNNSLTVENNGTVLFATTSFVIGESGSANKLLVTNHGTNLSYGSSVIGLNATASNN